MRFTFFTIIFLLANTSFAGLTLIEKNIRRNIFFYVTAALGCDLSTSREISELENKNYDSYFENLQTDKSIRGCALYGEFPEGYLKKISDLNGYLERLSNDKTVSIPTDLKKEIQLLLAAYNKTLSDNAPENSAILLPTFFKLPVDWGKREKKENECRICFEEVKLKSAALFECGHVHCKTCIEQLNSCTICNDPGAKRITLYVD